MSKAKKKISIDPSKVTRHRLELLCNELGIVDWKNKSREELEEEINKIAEFDERRAQILRILNINPTFRTFGEIWLDLFDKSKVWTSLTTGILALIFGIVANYSSHKNSQKAQEQRIENLDLVKQVDNLNDVEASLNSLIEFVQHQKSTIAETEQKLTNLNKEKEELEPLVNVDRQVINALFEQQNKFNQKKVWTERIIGFGLGIIGSIIASIIFNLFRRRQLKKRTQNSEESEAEIKETTDNKV